MAYQVAHTTNFERDMKQFKKNKPAKLLILEKVKEIIANPSIGEDYLHNLQGFKKYSFGESPQYRLIYTVMSCCPYEEKCGTEQETGCNGLINFVFIRTREECNQLYKKDAAYFEQYLSVQ